MYRLGLWSSNFLLKSKNLAITRIVILTFLDDVVNPLCELCYSRISTWWVFISTTNTPTLYRFRKNLSLVVLISNASCMPIIGRQYRMVYLKWTIWNWSNYHMIKLDYFNQFLTTPTSVQWPSTWQVNGPPESPWHVSRPPCRRPAQRFRSSGSIPSPSNSLQCLLVRIWKQV